jgi:hypothetical protein
MEIPMSAEIRKAAPAFLKMLDDRLAAADPNNRELLPHMAMLELEAILLTAEANAVRVALN